MGDIDLKVEYGYKNKLKDVTKIILEKFFNKNTLEIKI